MSNKVSSLSEDARSETPPSASAPSRARRLFAGWSANLVQVGLGIIQQVALVPVFLHYWSGDMLAAWLAIYAAGNLVPIADAGLQFRAINRFLGFKSGTDCDGRTAEFYTSLLRVYFGWVGTLVVLVLGITRFISPATVLGFQAIPGFDAAYLAMMTGMLLGLPASLVSGLYRARGLYGRAVGVQNWSMVIALAGQLIAVVATRSLLAVAIAYAAAQVAMMAYFVWIDAPRMVAPLRGRHTAHSWSWAVGQFRKAAPFGVSSATDLALVNLPVLLVSVFVSDRIAVAQWALTRVAAGLVRALCLQATLPLAAELGHDYALNLKDRLRGLYARGSFLIALLASVVVSGLLPFWPDFFSLWTHGAVGHDPWLTAIFSDRHHRSGALDPGGKLRQLQQSRGAPGADQGASAHGISDCIGVADPAAGAARRGYHGSCQRSPDPVRCAWGDHPPADAGAPGIACGHSSRADADRGKRGLGFGDIDTVRCPRNWTGEVHRRMCALVDYRDCHCKPARERAFPRKAECERAEMSRENIGAGVVLTSRLGTAGIPVL